MKSFTLAAAFAGAASAFPASFDSPAALERAENLVRRQNLTNDPLGISKAQTNCGPLPCLTFDAASQYVSTSGENEYRAPSADEIRGPCPGLNAAANHGYLPRSGIASIEQTITGLGAAYGLGPDACAALAAYAVAIDGNIVEGVWSIGGPLPADYISGELIGTGQGLSYSHNNYEGDASIGRNDAYLNGGDAHSLNITKFEKVYSVGGSEDRYTLDKFRQNFQGVQQESIANNPYYFTGAFSTVVVVPAAYNFVINLMSNHTAEEPSGYLDGSQFKQFFGVTGQPGSFVWQRGQERIPENWYRRPDTNQYNLNDIAADVLLTYLSYPDTLLLGGNTGTPNSFVGINLSNLTQNAYGVENLGEGDNFACFFTNLAEQGIPSFLSPEVNDVASVVSFFTNQIKSYTDSLSCPQVGQFDYNLFQQFPGYKYSPSGPATNY